MTTLDDIRARYLEVNGEHPMTPADEEYVRGLFVPLADDGDVLDLIADRRLPLPSYLLDDGTLMVHLGFLDNLQSAGDPSRVEAWFKEHWSADEQDTAAEEWESYLSGQYVCLYRVTPQTITAKTLLIEEIRAAAERVDADADDADARAALRVSVDELDALEPPFAPDYDRLRFGGPSSREVWIDGIRGKHLIPAAEPVC